MGKKKKKHVQTEKERLFQEEAAIQREQKRRRVYNEERKNIIVCLSIALALFLAFIGNFAWHTAIMRDYELNYVRVVGTVTGVEVRHTSNGSGHGSKNYYHLVISYVYEGKEYSFEDGVGHHSPLYDFIGKNTYVYVNPQNPKQAERVASAGSISIFAVVFFAFSCAAYSVGINLYLRGKGSTFKKRILFSWGLEILLGIAVLFLFWLGLPNSGFGEVYARIEGAVGITVVVGLILLVAVLDGILTYKFRKKKDGRTETIREVLKK